MLSDDITAAACEGPEAPPDVTFTFTTTPSQSTAFVGDTIEYSYCGTNTSTIPLEVVRVVDDRLGVVIESGCAVVGPGESVCNTDIGNVASYTVQPDDAGSVIHNNAVVTVRTQEAEPRQFQGTATSEVAVDLLRGLLGQDKDIRICHRTSSGDELNPLDPQNPNPYNPQDHNESSLIQGGHGNHEGPIWFPGITVQWGDIIEPFEQSDGTQNPGYNWPEGAAILNNDCEIPGPPRHPTTTTVDDDAANTTTTTETTTRRRTTTTTTTETTTTTTTTPTRRRPDDDDDRDDAATTTTTETTQPTTTTTPTTTQPTTTTSTTRRPRRRRTTTTADRRRRRDDDDRRRRPTTTTPTTTTTTTTTETTTETTTADQTTTTETDDDDDAADTTTTTDDDDDDDDRRRRSRHETTTDDDDRDDAADRRRRPTTTTTTTLPTDDDDRDDYRRRRRTTQPTSDDVAIEVSTSTTSSRPPRPRPRPSRIDDDIGDRSTTTTLMPPPPGITFTFTNDPSVPVAEVGDTVEYSYCGENTSDVDLEVVRVVDDRFGMLEVPEEQTIFRPARRCATPTSVCP